MSYQEEAKVRGDWTITRINHVTGEVEQVSRKNLIVGAGFDFLCDALGKAASRPGVMSHIAIGTNTVAAAAANTALGTEVTRVAATYSHTAGTKVCKFTATFNPGVGTGAITEAGLLNAAAAGIMLNRVIFPVMNKGADDTITVEFTFTLS